MIMKHYQPEDGLIYCAHEENEKRDRRLCGYMVMIYHPRKTARKAELFVANCKKVKKTEKIKVA